MIKANIELVSYREHCSQVLTGFLMLENEGKIQLKISNQIAQSSLSSIPIVKVSIGDLKLIYDVQDGYWNGMADYLDNCDYYFKRSFSREKNKTFTIEREKKIFPLGFNYSVYYNGNPYNLINLEKSISGKMKYLLGKHKPNFFIPNVFKSEFSSTQEKNPLIFFTTRLWTTNSDNEEKNEERKYINETRIMLIKKLRKEYGNQFIGGLQDFGNARKIAPELVFHKKYTERANYLKAMQNADICIGTMGLHESIGWKTAEYVAAGKAIVNETFHYEVPGNFAIGENYLDFNNVDSCLEAVQNLIDNRTLSDTMKCNNLEYYHNYLSPDKMIENSLKIANICLD